MRILSSLAVFSSLLLSAGFAYGTPPTVWNVVKIGAGGWLTGIDIAPDGVKVVRADTYGAYWFNPSTKNCGNAKAPGCWQQLVTTSSMPAAEQGVGLAGGVYEIAIAPSNTRRFYMMFNGSVYRSDNSGGAWNRTTFARIGDADANGAYRTFGRKMAVDPANADVVYVGTPSRGMFVSTDAGASWTNVSSIANSAAIGGVYPGHTISFDPHSGVSDGRTRGIFAASYGTGVYHSTDGGMNWTLTASTPTTFKHMIVDQRGTLWLCDNVGSGHIPEVPR